MLTSCCWCGHIVSGAKRTASVMLSQVWFTGSLWSHQRYQPARQFLGLYPSDRVYRCFHVQEHQQASFPRCPSVLKGLSSSASVHYAAVTMSKMWMSTIPIMSCSISLRQRRLLWTWCPSRTLWSSTVQQWSGWAAPFTWGCLTQRTAAGLSTGPPASLPPPRAEKRSFDACKEAHYRYGYCMLSCIRKKDVGQRRVCVPGFLTLCVFLLMLLCKIFCPLEWSGMANSKETLLLLRRYYVKNLNTPPPKNKIQQITADALGFHLARETSMTHTWLK